MSCCLACHVHLLQSRLAGCREVSVEGLLRNDAAASEPRKKKEREWAKRQRFQNLDADSLAAELASKAGISNENGSGAAVNRDSHLQASGICDLPIHSVICAPTSINRHCIAHKLPCVCVCLLLDS